MKYSNEEKLSIVARYQQGERITALSNELAISRSTLYRWLKSFPSDSIGKPLKFSYQEYASLQRKVEKLQNIITILKSADCLVSAPLKERLHALEPSMENMKSIRSVKHWMLTEVHFITTYCAASAATPGLINAVKNTARSSVMCLTNIGRCWVQRKFERFSFSVDTRSVRNIFHNSCVRWA